DQAVKWYRKAAEQSDAQAQWHLGELYLAGNGVPKNAKTALEWFGKSAAQGNALGQYSLGMAYLKGVGGSKDEKQGRALLQKAADQGLEEAKAALRKLKK